MSDRDQVIIWLQDAYAMERGIEEILQNHVKDAEDLPAMHTRLSEHLEETRAQAERIEQLLKSLDADVSKSKSTMAHVVGKMNGAMTGMYRDEIVKNALAEYSTEHFEIASYKSLISGAQKAAMPEVVRVCQEILAEEERMAEWLESHIGTVTLRYMEKMREGKAA